MFTFKVSPHDVFRLPGGVRVTSPLMLMHSIKEHGMKEDCLWQLREPVEFAINEAGYVGRTDPETGEMSGLLQMPSGDFPAVTEDGSQIILQFGKDGLSLIGINA